MSANINLILNPNAMQLQKTYVSSDGLRLFYRDYNTEADGCPILCLPGVSRNSRDFTELAERLSIRRRILCPDLRGRGFSDWDTDYKNYTPPVYLQDVLGLLRKEKIEKVALIGTSLGGIIAMLMAVAAPGVLERVVMNDIGPEIAPEGLQRVLDYLGTMPPQRNWEDAAKSVKANLGPAAPDLKDADWNTVARQVCREDKDGRVALDMDPKIGDAAREAAPPEGDPWRLFQALTPIPTLAIRGALSDLLTDETFEKMALAKPDLERVTVPNRGHAPFLNEPAAWTAIETFLK
ncbi:MAG: alpha/beta hydrolase [Pseudomonadota bacterium]